MRDLRFAVDFNCESVWSDCESEADSEIRSLMSELGVLGDPDSQGEEPRYEIDFLIDECSSFPTWGFVQNFFAVATLGIVVPFFVEQSSTEIVAVVSEQGRDEGEIAADLRLREVFVAMRGGSVFLYGEAYDETFAQREIVASAASTFDYRFYGSLLLPMSCLGAQRHCITILAFLGYGDAVEFVESSMPPGAWRRESLEITTRRSLLDIIRQLPTGPAPSKFPSPATINESD